MKSKTDRRKIRDIREKYAHDFARRLKAKDEAIARLQAELDAERSAHAATRRELGKCLDEASAMREQLKDMAARNGMTEQDLDDLRKDMANRKKAVAAIEQLRALGGLYGL